MAMDLAGRHEPVGQTFLLPSTDDGWRRCELSPEQVRHYVENGWVAGIRVLDDTQLKVLRTELDALMAHDPPGRELFYEYHHNESRDPDLVLFHALGAWRIMPGFHDLLWDPAITRPASQLLGGPVRFWHDQLFVKPAMYGGVVAWHQDYSYWTRTRPIAHLTCWIALDDATRENGCVHYVSGSHRWELLPVTGLAGDMNAIRSVLTPERERALDNAVAVELKAGEAVFHHALTVHGSYENRSDRPRRATVVNMMRDGVVADLGESLLEGVPPIHAGDKVDGRFFPLLHDPDEPGVRVVKQQG